MKPRTLLRLYPAPWRERYGDEFVALLEKEGTGPRVVLNVLAGAFDAWISPRSPSEMALDGPFGPGVLRESGNRDVSTRERWSFIGLGLALGGLFYAVLALTTDRHKSPLAFHAFITSMSLVMPFLWLRYFSLRTRIAAALWGVVFTAGIPLLIFGVVTFLKRVLA